MKEQIRYRNLSVPLKIAIVSAYIVGIIYGLAVLYGFFLGMAGVI